MKKQVASYTEGSARYDIIIYACFSTNKNEDVIMCDAINKMLLLIPTMPTGCKRNQQKTQLSTCRLHEDKQTQLFWSPVQDESTNNAGAVGAVVLFLLCQILFENSSRCFSNKKRRVNDTPWLARLFLFLFSFSHPIYKRYLRPISPTPSLS